MKVEIVPATKKHVEEIAAAVRPEDREELWAASMQRPEDAMLSGLRYSDQAMAGLVNGKAVCIWGVVPESFIGPMGTPWMVASMALDEHAKAFLRRCKKMVQAMFGEYEHLENYVDARNKRSIEWLKWLGFLVEPEPQPYGMLKQPFHRFTMRRNHV